MITFFMAEVFVGLTGCDESMIHDSERKDFNDQSEGLENEPREFDDSGHLLESGLDGPSRTLGIEPVSA